MEFYAIRHIQRRLSVVASVAAVVLSANAFVARLVFYDDAFFRALLHPTVAPTFGIGLLVALTGLTDKQAARYLQVLILLGVGCASATTAVGGDLTGAVFYGLGMLVAGEYGFLTERRLLKLVVAVTPFLLFYGYGLLLNTRSLVLAALQTFLGGGLVAYLFYSVAAARLQELANRQAELEAMVEERTSTLKSEVERRRLAEDDLRTVARRSTQLAGDREVLLQALHHRTKNDLQLISSIMNIKASKDDNPETNELFRPIQSRIKAIALIHEQLDGSERYDQLSLRSYLVALLGHLQFLHSEFRVIILPDIRSDMMISLEAAEHLGLLINELVLLTYAQSYDRLSTGRIHLRVETGDEVTVVLSDDGRPLPPSIDPQAPDESELGIAAGLLRSLGATISLTTDGHTEWVITVPRRNLDPDTRSV